MGWAHSILGKKWKKKLEVVFVVRIPSKENRDPRRLVPGRDNVYILPKSECVPDEKGEYFFYPNENIVSCFILRSPDDDAVGKLAARNSSTGIARRTWTARHRLAGGASSGT